MQETFPDPAVAAETVWEHLHRHYSLAGDTYSIAQGDTNIALITHAEKQTVIKVPLTSCIRDAEDTAYFESRIVSSLHENAKTPPPLATPRLLNYDTSPLPYGMYSYLPGEIVTTKEIRTWSATAKNDLGRKIGAFVAWMESAMSLERYQEIRSSAPYAVISDREDYLHGGLLIPRYMQLAAHNQDIATFFAQTRRLYIQQKAEGALKPTIIGHDDLWTGNMVFDNARTLRGIFDFGLTKPSSPERELRHTAAMGKEVTLAAVAEYERQTHKKVSIPLLGFWAIAQTATNLEFSILWNKQHNASQKHHDLLAIRTWLEEFSAVEHGS